MAAKRSLFLFTGFILALTGVIIFFIILPTAKEIKKMKNLIYNERVDLEKKYMRGQLLNKVIKNFESVKAEKDRLNSVFVNEGQELEFVTTIEKNASENNLTQEIQMKSSKDNGSYVSSALGINTSGTFLNTLKYINELGRMNYNFNINSISIITDEKTNTVNTSITGEYFILKAKR